MRVPLLPLLPLLLTSISTIDEKSAINERSIIDNIASITEISNTSHKNQINEGDTDVGLNFQNVKNPNKVINKGRPPKRRYMNSVEKSRGIPRSEEHTSELQSL